MENWWDNVPDKTLQNLPHLICWGVWIMRNKATFQDIISSPNILAAAQLSIYFSIPNLEKEPVPHIIIAEEIDHSFPWAYFDGASDGNNACGWGIGSL